ncbi:Lrp/AsnC family transcriptional regulator [Candidatus Woesearchaeota archaeon]|nr:Lrp/AsnC family transcriptional regulator [Candidatus Woesearchaeota archaeon]
MVKKQQKRTLDEAEIKIVRELIRNPRASDNKIAKKTKIPVMTVNRKRKLLEQESFLRYYASIDKGEFGLDIFGAKQLYVIKFKIGITRKKYVEVMETNRKWRTFNSRHVSMAYLGEKDGHLALMVVLDAIDEAHLVDDFNGNIVPFLYEKLSEDCIEEIETTSLNKLIRVHHNYMPHTNMECGKIKEDWSDDLIFVNEVEDLEEDKQEKLV